VPTGTIALKLRPYFALEWERHVKEKGATEALRPFDKNTMPCKRLALPQQSNCSDCGCFLLTYIEARAAAAACVLLTVSVCVFCIVR
jgi:Ulp1 family protease